MKRPTQLVLFVLATLLAVGTASAGKQHRYVGIHPVPKAQGGGMCHIQAPHVHAFAAMDAKIQFRDHDGWNHFVGDPVAYGWDGPRHAYYGHHPVPVHVVVGDDHEDTEYCYLDGAHYHAWAPPADLELELRGGAYWFVGDFPRAYVEARPVYDPIDVVYTPIRYERPVVEVSVAPPQWYGAVVVAPVVVTPPPRPRPAHVQGGVQVHVPAPRLRIEVAVPTVQIGIGGGVVVREHRHYRKHKKYKKHKHHRGHDHDDDDDDD